MREELPEDDWPISQTIYHDLPVCNYCDSEIKDGGILNAAKLLFCNATCLCGHYQERG